MLHLQIQDCSEVASHAHTASHASHIDLQLIWGPLYLPKLFTVAKVCTTPSFVTQYHTGSPPTARGAAAYTSHVHNPRRPAAVELGLAGGEAPWLSARANAFTFENRNVLPAFSVSSVASEFNILTVF